MDANEQIADMDPRRRAEMVGRNGGALRWTTRTDGSVFAVKQPGEDSIHYTDAALPEEVRREQESERRRQRLTRLLERTAALGLTVEAQEDKEAVNASELLEIIVGLISEVRRLV